MLIEKAWIKFHNNKISGGLMREVLHDLTGAPTVTFFTQKENLFEKI